MSTENLTNLASVQGETPEETARELRRWAIERAITAGESHYSDIVKAAGAFVDFVNGTGGADDLRVVRELADKVKG